MSERCVQYRVSWPQPANHLFHVEARFPGPLPATAEVHLPVWNPGSYLVREFARHVRDLQATDPAGRVLQVRKTGKATWSIDGAADGVVVSYRVFAHDLGVRTSHLDPTHAFFNGATVFVYGSETRALPARLSLAVPDGWSVATALPEANDGWLAEDYDHLIDSPVEAGTHRSVRFEVDGIRHDVAVWGDGNADLEVVRRDLAALVTAARDVMGSLPYQRYLFIVHLAERRGGGLEHRDSCVLHYPRFGFRPRRAYEDFLDLASHELFHVWNVKRIRPRAFAPYDYGRENVTDLLWAMEGITDYYAPLICRRGELLPADRYLELLGESLTQLARTPGRLVHSLEEVSRDAWIRLYRPDEDTPNSSVSYYLKGHVVAALLDLEIRVRSGDRRSLDDVMRWLVAQANENQSLAEGGFGAAVRAAIGVDVEDLLASYVRGTADIDYPAHLRHAGLLARARPRESFDDRGGKPAPTPSAGETPARERPYLGAAFREDGGRLVAVFVANGSPAEEGGLAAGDELIAVGGWRVTDTKAVEARLAEHPAGEPVGCTVFRRDQLRMILVRTGRRPLDTWWIEPDPGAAPEARARYRAWLGAPHPGDEGAAPP